MIYNQHLFLEFLDLNIFDLPSDPNNETVQDFIIIELPTAHWHISKISCSIKLGKFLESIVDKDAYLHGIQIKKFLFREDSEKIVILLSHFHF